MGCWPEWFRILIDNNTVEHAITVGLLNVFSATDGLMKKRFLAVWNVYLFHFHLLSSGSKCIDLVDVFSPPVRIVGFPCCVLV